MAVKPYLCSDCGKEEDQHTGFEMVCSCGSKKLTEVIGRVAGVQMKGFDYSKAVPGTPEYAMAISNRNRIEREAESFLDGSSRHVVPKGVPEEFRPRVPAHLKKTYSFGG